MSFLYVPCFKINTWWSPFLQCVAISDVLFVSATQYEDQKCFPWGNYYTLLTLLKLIKVFYSQKRAFVKEQ